MLSKGAVVIIKRGDAAIAQAIENGLIPTTKLPEEFMTMERDYSIMKIGRESEIQRKIRQANNKYGRRKPTGFERFIAILTRPILWLEVLYAMIAVGLEWLLEPLFDDLNLIPSRKKHDA